MTKGPAANKGLNAMGAEVLNSAFVLLLNSCTKLNICAFNPPLRQAPARCASFPIFPGAKIISRANEKIRNLKINVNLKVLIFNINF